MLIKRHGREFSSSPKCGNDPHTQPGFILRIGLSLKNKPHLYGTAQMTLWTTAQLNKSKAQKRTEWIILLLWNWATGKANSRSRSLSVDSDYEEGDGGVPGKLVVLASWPGCLLFKCIRFVNPHQVVHVLCVHFSILLHSNNMSKQIGLYLHLSQPLQWSKSNFIFTCVTSQQ